MEDRTLEPNQLSEGPPTTVITDDDESESESDQGEELEFEFPFVSRDSPAGTADELFADGVIRPFYYPVFGHGGTAATTAPPPPRVRGQLGRLFLEESRARSSTSSDDGLEGAPPESYCLWTPGSSSPRPPRKSGSTGSMARWRRISDLVVGRSHSDGKEKLMFFPAPQPRPKEAAVKLNSMHHHDKPKPKPKPGPASGATRKQAPAEVPPRRTFLPYREELVGFFANVNGISRSHQQHPF